MAKRITYTDKFKADCLALLIASDYPANPFKLEEVARHVGVPSRTLRRWFNGQNGTPPDDVVTEEKEELSDLFEQAAQVYLRHSLQSAVVADVSGNAAIVAAATATDKMRLLRGLPTEIVAIMPDLLAALSAAGMDAAETFQRMIQKANERAASNRLAG